MIKKISTTDETDIDFLADGEQATAEVLNRPIKDLAIAVNNVSDTIFNDFKSALSNFVSKSADYTAIANDFIYADTSSGGFVITLPADPLDNDVITILDNTSSFDKNSLSVARNGKNIMGLAEDMVVDVKNISLELIFNGTEWRVK